MAWTHTRSKIAHYGRQHPGEPIPIELKRQLKAERLEEHVRRVVAEAPPLTPEQADRIAALLRGAACGR